MWHSMWQSIHEPVVPPREAKVLHNKAIAHLPHFNCSLSTRYSAACRPVTLGVRPPPKHIHLHTDLQYLHTTHTHSTQHTHHTDHTTMRQMDMVSPAQASLKCSYHASEGMLKAGIPGWLFKEKSGMLLLVTT